MRSAAAAVLLVLAACAPGTPTAADLGIHVDCAIEPSPPTVGPARARLALQDSGGTPLGGARLSVEGNMDHAGMVPSMAQVAEVAPGRYEASFEFTMGGDWFLWIEGELADGRRFEHKVDVPAVRRAQ